MTSKTSSILQRDALLALAQTARASYDVILADPPYNIGKDFGNDSDKQSLDKYLQWSQEWITLALSTLTEKGTLYVYGYPEILALIRARLPLSLNVRWLTWHYTNKNSVANPYWQRSQESILCITKSNTPIFNKDAVRVPYSEGFLKVAGRTRAATPGRFSSKDTETTYTAHEKGALPRDVICIPALSGQAGRRERWGYCHDCKEVVSPSDMPKHKGHQVEKHPTQKPLALSRYLLRAALPPSGQGRVCVPFSGSGSEVVAGVLEGAISQGYDLNPIFVAIGQAWLKGVLND